MQRFLHQWNKDEEKSDANRSAGSTAIRQAVRFVYALKETIYGNVKIFLATKPNYNNVPILESTFNDNRTKIHEPGNWDLKLTQARGNWSSIVKNAENEKYGKGKIVVEDYLREHNNPMDSFNNRIHILWL